MVLKIDFRCNNFAFQKAKSHRYKFIAFFEYLQIKTKYLSFLSKKYYEL